MLQGDIDVFDQLAVAGKFLYELFGDDVWIAVQQPQATDVFQRGQPLDEFDELILPVQFLAVAGGVLRHEDELGKLAQRRRLLHQLFHGIGAVPAADLGDEAVGAVVAAAVGDLQIAVMQGRGEDARALPLPPRMHGVDPLARVRALEGRKQGVGIGAADKHVPFREGGEQFADVFFGQAAGDDQLFQLAAAAGVAFDDRIDRLFARLVEEGAGIDDEHLRFGNVCRDPASLGTDEAEQPLGIDAVFIAAEGDHAECLVL